MDDLKQIKKYYGEKMMQLCRQLFPQTLEQEGLLFETLTRLFAPSHLLYDDIVNEGKTNVFQELIALESGVNENAVCIETNESPEELLAKAGYDLYECKTQRDIEQFKKYFAPGEELCTFKDERTLTHYVFFAVRKDVDQIKRNDTKFAVPQREDEYGRSVISIQFRKGTANYLSIKNRYNHTVVDPDNTFYNNLENIIPGLTKSFEHKYGLNITNRYREPGERIYIDFNNYEICRDGKYHKVIKSLNNIRILADNMVDDGTKVITLDKGRYLFIEGNVFDLRLKKFIDVETMTPSNEIDPFQFLSGTIEKVTIENEDLLRRIIIKYYDLEDVVIKINNEGRIISFENPNIKETKKYFMSSVTKIKEISLKNAELINEGFLLNATDIETILIPSAKIIKEKFCFWASNVKRIDISSAEIIDNEFLMLDETLEEISAPKLRQIGDDALRNNQKIRRINFPNITKIGSSFMKDNNVLEELRAPYLVFLGELSLKYNKSLKKIEVPSLKTLGKDALYMQRLLRLKLKISNVLKTINPSNIMKH